MRRSILVALFALAAVVLAKDPIGTESVVNDPTAGQQGTASFGGRPVAPVAIASRFDGSYLVAWNETEPGGVYARLFGPDGVAEGPQFKVANGARTALDVGMALDGSFVVVWNGLFGEGAIEARRYTAGGTPAGDAFVVSAGQPNCSSSAFRWPQVAVAPDGAFAIVWTCDTGLVFARRYDADGLGVGGVVDLNAQAQIVSSRSDALLDGGGTLWVFHESSCRIAPGSDTYSLPCATRFNAAGSRVGEPVPLGPQGAFGTLEPASGLQAARDAAGNFALAWIRGEADRRVVARSYAADGAPLGAEFVFPAGETLVGTSRVGMSEDGAFVVVYGRRVAGDATRSEIIGREFAPDGASAGPAFQVHADTASSNEHGVVAVGPDADYVAAFASARSGDSDVYARRFGAAPPAPVDLAVTIDDFPDPVAPGAELVWEVNVEKLTEGQGAREIVVDVATDGSRLRIEGAADERNFSCAQTGGGGVRCLLDMLEASTDNFVVRADAPNTPPAPATPQFVTTTATVGALNSDPVPANNSSQARTRVGARGALQFVATATALFSALENAGSIAVQVERVGGNVGAASVEVQLLSFGDLGAGDIAFPAGARLSWADGESGPRTLTVPIVQDTLDEPDEFRDILLADAQGAPVQGPPGGRIEVRDEDEPPRVSLAPAAQAAPNEGAALSAAVILDRASAKEIRVGLAYAGTAIRGADYAATPGPGELVFAPGDTQKPIRLDIADDAAEEAEESILVDLDFSSALNVRSGAQTRHTVTIPANDAPTPADVAAFVQGSADPIAVGQRRVYTLTAINFGPAGASAVNSQLRVQNARIVEFPRPPAEAIACQRSNLDRTLDCALGAIGANQERSYTVTVEAPAEPGELTLLHSVLSGQLDPSLANNDAARAVEVRAALPGVVRFWRPDSYPVRIAEYARPHFIQVSRTGGEGPASVGLRIVAAGTDPATEGADYTTYDGRLAFGSSPDGAYFDVSVADDDLPEGLETVTIELIDPQGVSIDPAASTYTLIIADDDGGLGDTEPEPFVLQSEGLPQQALAAPGAEVITDPVTVRGIGGPAPISVQAGGGKALGNVGYSIDAAPFTSDDGTVEDGDRVRLRIVAPTAGASRTGTLIIGGVAASFTVVSAVQEEASVPADGGGALGSGALWLALLALIRRPRAAAAR